MPQRHAVMIFREGRGDIRPGAHGLHHDGINREGIFGKNRRVLRCKKGARHQFQDIIGTIAQGNIPGLQLMPVSQCAT